MPELYPYQRRAVRYVHERRRAGLLLEPGLGKTAVMLSSLTPERLPALVIAPKRVTEEVWPQEQQLWRPDLSLALAAGPKSRREDVLGRSADITVISRDNLADAVNGRRYSTLILDELSSFKNRGTKRWRAARKLAESTRHVYGLTGTPSSNGLMDLWAQMYLLDSGVRLGHTLGGYRNRYFVPGRQLPNGVVIDWSLRPGADRRIHALLEDICLSMRSEDYLDLPEVTVNPVRVSLPAAVRRTYERMKDDLVASVDTLGTVTAANAAVLGNKLAQISAGFIYEDDLGQKDKRFRWLHDAKLSAVQEIVEGSAGSPVLVFYRFRPELEALKRALPEAATINDKDVIKRWNAGEIPVLLAHPASAGHGLNMQHGGHTCIWTTLPWSLEEWDQANKRLHRQGQRDNVIIHVIAAKDTVDSRVMTALRNKKSVSDALMDHLADKGE